MLLIPAIDLKEGKVVRLAKGDFTKLEEFDIDPVEAAIKFAKDGAKWIHTVDLYGALEGRFKEVNLDVVKKIVSEVSKYSVNVEFGGGIRSFQDIKKVFDYTNVSRIILGTLALEDTDFVKKAVLEYKERIAVSVDAKNTVLVKKGWKEESKKDINNFLKELENCGLKTLIYTNITKDGMMQGPDFQGIENILSSTKIPVIASGGVSSIEDIKKLKELESQGLCGVIVGKAIYKGKIDLKQALKIC